MTTNLCIAFNHIRIAFNHIRLATYLSIIFNHFSGNQFLLLMTGSYWKFIFYLYLVPTICSKPPTFKDILCWHVLVHTCGRCCWFNICILCFFPLQRFIVWVYCRSCVMSISPVRVNCDINVSSLKAACLNCISSFWNFWFIGKRHEI